MGLNEHQKYIIDKILEGDNPIDNLNVLIHNAVLTKESLEYVRSNALALGYEMKKEIYNQAYGCYSTPHPDPDTSCKPYWGGCGFIPSEQEVISRAGRSK